VSFGTPNPRDTTGFSHEIPTDFPREIPTDFPHEIPTDFPREIPTDFPREIPSDFPREIPSDFPREIPSDPHGIPRVPTLGFTPVVKTGTPLFIRQPICWCYD
jgi:hypothetical protein